MTKIYKNPKGKFFNPPEASQEKDSLTIQLDSLALRLSGAEGKLEKKIIKKYFSEPGENNKSQVIS
ncbi:hypothetical protein ACFL7D_05815 [candidate division KSB1 bacterium]